MEGGDSQGFSIREYTRKRRSVELRKCWPFSGDFTVDLIQSILPPITVVKFRWWSHELASLLAKPPPTTVDDSDSSYKKHCIVEIPPQIQLVCKEEDGERDDDDSFVLIGSKRKRTRDCEMYKKIKSKESSIDSGEWKIANKVDRSREQARENVAFGKKESCSGAISPSSRKAGSVSEEQGSKFQVPGILKAEREVRLVRSPDKSNGYTLQGEMRVRSSDQSENDASLELCCVEMNKMSLFSSKDQSPLNVEQTKVMRSNQNSVAVHLEVRQQNKFWPAVSGRQFSNIRARSEFPYFSEQPIQPLSSTSSETTRRSCSTLSQPASADLHWGNLSPVDPLLGEPILGFPLNLQGKLLETNGEGCRSFDLSGLGVGSSQSACTRTDILRGNVVVDLSNGKKRSTEKAALVEDGVDSFPVHNEKPHKYFPTRLGVDETFTETAFFISDTKKDADCGQAVYSPASEVSPRSNTVDLSQHNDLNQNLDIKNVVSNRNGLCLHNTQATMRLMGKNVSVGTSYSDMVSTGERIMAPDASVNCSFLDSHTRQSWLWRRPTFGFSESHSTVALDTDGNRALLRHTPSEFPPTILNPCCSLASFPLSNTNLSFHGTGLGQAFAFSQQQLPLPFSPLFAGLPSDYCNVGFGLLPDATKPSLGIPFSCTDSTRLLQPHLPQSSFGCSRSGMSSINPTEQLVSFYVSKPTSYINAGTTNKQASNIYRGISNEEPQNPQVGNARWLKF